MRILFWNELFPPLIGGASLLTSRLVTTLARRGHELAVIASHQGQDLPDEESFGGVPVYRFPFWTTISTGDLEGVLRIREGVSRIKRELSPDIVHFNFTGPSSILHLLTRRGSHSRSVVAVHVSPPRPEGGHGSLTQRLLESADWITTTSRAVLDKVRTVAPSVALHSSVVYNGIQIPEDEPLPLGDGNPRLLAIGRLVEEKGFDLALDATAQLLPRYPGLRLRIVGEGQARSGLERRAEELGITRSVDFTGWVEPSRVFSVISESTVVVMPSRWEEAFGMVAVEAALMERAVVATRTGGLPEVVVDGRTGLTVPREDAGALADALDLLLRDRALATRLGKTARERAISVFGWKKYVDTYEELYRRVVAGVPSAVGDVA